MVTGLVLMFFSAICAVVGVFCWCERYIMIGIIGMLIGIFLEHDLPVLLGYKSSDFQNKSEIKIEMK